MTRTRQRATGFARDFRDFIAKGNVVDLAVAVIIGGAFGKIITSFVEDIVMPGLINPALGATGDAWRELTLGPLLIGKFLGTVVDFLIIAFVIFLVIRAIENFKRKEVADPDATPADANLLAQERLTTAIERLTQVMESRQ
ncbi:large conductance mechanosensitive channel protein MscL [Oscillatoria sp. FACHB-1406]|uniref:large conductance mechanosensitive channel protein MscL n=1 Tax=Oscillatoria sp. FACHB-1406 TaxID=2692846 RepID=UPI0016853921|nr:large conductance mechanosensitive channel protein MscL [Oscillatoria sp. FACHB-1406]MBD2580574.1 large conductance mechanosensitive channel protein MscL [Oscillatoria sp. FACHB-1406]